MIPFAVSVVDTIEIEPVVIHYWIPITVTVVVFLLLILGLATRQPYRLVFSILCGVGSVVVLVGSIVAANEGTYDAEEHIIRHQTAALFEQLGYDDAVITERDGSRANAFIASDDAGRFVQGNLLRLDTDVYVVILQD